jgi:ABC-type uncharacterized transport system permease subunit
VKSAYSGSTLRARLILSRRGIAHAYPGDKVISSIAQIPNAGQVCLLLTAAALFAGSVVLTAVRAWRENRAAQRAAKICRYFGVLLGLIVLVWHSYSRRSWIPLEDNFDAFAGLGVLLAGCVIYVQWRRPVPGLDWFVLPIAVGLLVLAVVFGKTEPRAYATNPWLAVHWITAFGGAVAFALAAAVGLMYLWQNRRLRSKKATMGPKLGSLERLESFAQTAVTIGFALLSVGLITGVARIVGDQESTRLGPHWFLTPKVLLAAGAWVVYAMVLHTPINPSFRGRKAAMLSIVGFVLMVGALVAVQYMPGGGK